jgi:short-subunit dehydrogenase
VSARSREPLEAMEAASAGGIRAYPLDVTDRAASAEVAARIWKDLGRIDTVVLAAGTYEPVTAETFDVDCYRRQIEINYMGVVHALAGIVPAMIERGAGHIAVVSSVAGYRGLPKASAYGATKAALINLTEALKFDLDRHGIKTQLVCPGFVRTPLTDRNDFKMPMLMEVEDAADALYRGLSANRFEITFPRAFAMIVKQMAMLPYCLYFAAVRRGTGL